MFKKKSKVIIVDDVLSKTVHNFLYNFTRWLCLKILLQINDDLYEYIR